MQKDESGASNAPLSQFKHKVDCLTLSSWQNRFSCYLYSSKNSMLCQCLSDNIICGGQSFCSCSAVKVFSTCAVSSSIFCCAASRLACRSLFAQTRIYITLSTRSEHNRRSCVQQTFADPDWIFPTGTPAYS